MEKKYYTPEVEDLCFGMEIQHNGCNVNFEESEYKDDVISIHNINSIAYDLTYNQGGKEQIARNNSVRVKYLDQEDIESLGFKQIANDCFNISNIDYRGKTNCDLRLLVRETILIYVIDTEENNYTLFTGHIKNKSELSKLMKQLKIMK